MNSTPRPRLRNPAAAFTLVEVLISSLVMTVLLGGIMAMMIQSRRLTESSIYQNSTVTILQGYIEQMKNMEYTQVLVSPSSAPATPYVIPTVLGENLPDPLTVSYGTPPATLPAIGTTPTGAVDNAKTIDINNTPSNPNDDLKLNIWVWVQDLTGSAASVTNAKSIYMIYTWQFTDGGRTRSYRGSLRTVRSMVPTY